MAGIFPRLLLATQGPLWYLLFTRDVNESQEQPAYLYFILYLPLGQIHRFIVTNLIRESYFTLSAIIINSCESPTYNIPLSLSLCCLLSALELSLSLCSPECTMYYGP
uniref:Uncharacterized protein n=1 Tax=Cacopsylla melanoneura TaxID=428564 RepID=A0A8D9BYM6_9HEMI